ncbi:hypothetical protein HELRODRAFT_185844 [Helobdella robusta]|uniref:Sorting nexin n=1 Tax=Helobdella robusta TaxID=6412 RepID=T1FND0_HELRO|nr:hypothetical protein HELRODRAFT_185844 [Helobdella robusta]ESN98565.1 hypothetical protein HELRODRAFT_185844 [Helobdella robusta]
MAKAQAKALYDFESGGPGELSFNADDILTILRQDVGAGWWEAINNRGETGLVPQSYFDVISYKEPTMPPPLPPANTKPTWGGVATKPNRPITSQHSLHPPQQQQIQQQSQINNAQDDYDDDWDDDDDSSTTTEQEQNSVETNGTRGVRNSDDKGKPSVKVSAFSRFSSFVKSGGEAYLFENQKELSESEKMFAVIETMDGPAWQSLDVPYSCSITSPKKESKFHGIKTFIAYQLTPSFSNIQVSRRYKHFDWLQQRLVVKFSTIPIPPLPEKQISGRFEEDFVTQRLRQLQMWIDRMCQHPVIAKSEVFLHFLTCTDEKKWKIGKRQAEKDDLCGAMFFRAVKVPQFPSLDSKQADMSIEKFGKFVKSLDDSLRHLTAISESNVKKHIGPFKKEFQKLGGSFTALAKSFEYDERPASLGLTKAIEHTGRTYDEIGELFAKQPQNDMLYLLEGLHSYKGLLSTVPDTLMIHKSAQTKIQDQSSKLTSAELQKVQNRADVISYAILADVEHLQRYRVHDFANYMRAYLGGQIEFYKQITQKLEESLKQYPNDT